MEQMSVNILAIGHFWMWIVLTVILAATLVWRSVYRMRCIEKAKNEHYLDEKHVNDIVDD